MLNCSQFPDETVSVPRVAILIKLNFFLAERAKSEVDDDDDATPLSLLSINYRLVYTLKERQRERESAATLTPGVYTPVDTIVSKDMPSFSSHAYTYRTHTHTHTHIVHARNSTVYCTSHETRSNDGWVRRCRKRPLMSIVRGSSSASCISAPSGEKREFAIFKMIFRARSKLARTRARLPAFPGIIPGKPPREIKSIIS